MKDASLALELQFTAQQFQLKNDYEAAQPFLLSALKLYEKNTSNSHQSYHYNFMTKDGYEKLTRAQIFNTAQLANNDAKTERNTGAIPLLRRMTF